MCLLPKVAKILDPAGYVVEKTTPKAFAPFSGLHGTSVALRPTEPARPSEGQRKLLGE